VERVLRFLVSRRSLVGFAAAGVGLALHLVGLLTGPLWLTIVVAMYVVGAVVVPKERGPQVQLDAAAETAAIRDGLDELLHQVRFKIAADLLAHVESIRKLVLAMLEHWPDRRAGDPTLFLIRQTALDYLPSALSAYIALPRIYAERRKSVDGRTPHDVLLEQLELMDSRMHEAYDALLAHDSERVLEEGRFLADRFGRSSLRLDAPAGDAVAMQVPDAEASAPDAASSPTEDAASRSTEAAAAAERERVP
jgi:hypothetical protein